MSPAFTASGSIRRLSSCLRPSILAVTVPPPEVASTTVSCIFFCRLSYCDLALDISSCRLKFPMRLFRAKDERVRPFLFLLPIIDYGTNLGPELLAQAPHHGILFRPAAAGQRRAIRSRSSAIALAFAV